MKPAGLQPTDGAFIDGIVTDIAWIKRHLGGDSGPGDRTPLGAHLAPGWANPVNTSVTDISDPFCPTYYIDRDRVFLGGVVQLSVADLGGFADYIVLDGLPSEILPTRQIDVGVVAEDMYWSNTGWQSHTGIISIDPASFRIVTGGDDDPLDDGVAISLEPFSWRIDS